MSLMLRYGTDPHCRLAVAEAEIVERRAPAVRRQAQIGDDARRGDRDNAVGIFQDAGDELAGAPGKPMLAARIIGRRRSRPCRRSSGGCGRRSRRPAGSRIGVKVAWRPSADATARTISRTISAWSAIATPRCGPTVTSNWSAPYSFMNVSGAIPARAHRPEQPLAKSALGAKPGERVGLATRTCTVPKLELVLESADERQTGDPFEPGERRLQQRTCAIVPWRAVGVSDVADDELLGSRLVAERNTSARCGVGDQHEIAKRTEWAFGDRVEAGDLDIGRRPADAALQTLVEIRGGESLAPRPCPRGRCSTPRQAAHASLPPHRPDPYASKHVDLRDQFLFACHGLDLGFIATHIRIRMLPLQAGQVQLFSAARIRRRSRSSTRTGHRSACLRARGPADSGCD